MTETTTTDTMTQIATSLGLDDHAQGALGTMPPATAWAALAGIATGRRRALRDEADRAEWGDDGALVDALWAKHDELDSLVSECWRKHTAYAA